MKILCATILILIIQSSRKLVHVTTAKLSSHVQNFDLIGSVFVS